VIEKFGLALLLLALAGCDSFQPTGTNSADDSASCLAGDTAIPSKALCLMDDAACYQVDGQWCTGPRAGTGG